MPTPEDIARLTSLVLLATFALSALLGAIVHRTNFCTMGAISDALNMGHWDRMRQWALAAGVAMIGFGALAAWGAIRAQDAVYASPRWMWLSAMVGGLLFGFGMVLASGCGSKTLVRLGGGNLKSLVVFCVLGLAAYATLRGVVAVWRVNTVDAVWIELPATQDLPSLLAHATGIARTAAIAIAGGAVGIALVGWALARPEGRSAGTLLGGVGIGALVVAAWWASGRLGFVAEHPDTLERVFLATNTRSMESFTFVAPIAYTLDWVIRYSDSSLRLSFGVVTVVGVVVGSAAAAIASGSFRWEGFAGTEDTANHVVGGALMGVGGVTAFGCTVGQGLSGVSTLSLGSFVAVAGIVAGALAALRYQAWRMERMA